MRRVFALCVALSLVWLCLGVAYAESDNPGGPTKSLSGDAYALRDVSWNASAQQVADQEGVQVQKDGSVVVEKPEIYKLEAETLTYKFDQDGVLQSRVFQLKKDANNTQYASIFVSLLGRYGMPYFIDDKNSEKLWVLDDATVDLSEAKSVLVTFSRRPDVTYVGDEPVSGGAAAMATEVPAAA